jgi:LmbE family N-acetylglucosaminyl deacetylase
MKLSQPRAEIWVPDGATETESWARVTHMAIAAHQDDVEVMALEGILAGFGTGNRCFMAVIVTNGAGSPRNGRYANHSDEEMQVIRRLEQKKAGFVGEYSAVALLDHASTAVKSAKNSGPKEDLKAIVGAAQPKILYTHNLADKHDTHVAVTLRTIEAIRELPIEQRPNRLLGCEVWRDLDWLVDGDKVVFCSNKHDNIAATFFQSHNVDTAESINFGMDLTPLIYDDQLDPSEYVSTFVRRFATDVNSRIERLR